MSDDKACVIVGLRQKQIATNDGGVITLCDAQEIPKLRKNLISSWYFVGQWFLIEIRILLESMCVLTVMIAQKTIGNIYRLLGRIVVG